MKFLDFQYDGINLSDFGFIACTFDASSGLNVASAGSKITFTKVSTQRGKRYSLVNAEYGECLTATFDICKDPCKYPTQPEMVITNDEYRDIMRWLNRRKFCPFRLIPDESVEEVIDTCTYNASFNIEKIKLAEELIGLRLTMETDKPFGYGDEVIKTISFTTATQNLKVYDDSDEVGDFYPDLEITIDQGGDLILYNSTLDVSMSIRNCTAGEVITLKGQEQIILTSDSTHDISNDFNYEFFKLGNTLNNRLNNITSSLRCTIKFTYKPIIKGTL